MKRTPGWYGEAMSENDPGRDRESAALARRVVESGVPFGAELIRDIKAHWRRWCEQRRAKRVPFVVDYKQIPFAQAVEEMARVWPWRGIGVKLEERDGVVEKLEARRG